MRVEHNVLTESQPGGLSATGEVDDRALVLPFFPLDMAIHETEGAAVAVKQTQWIPKHVLKRLVRPCIDTVVCTRPPAVVNVFNKQHLLSRILELEEPFSEGQKGSSAMPHKRNPILSENLCGLSRLVRSYAISALENIPLWHERDISHSSVERVIGPDGTILVDFMLNRLDYLLDGLQVYPENMEKNIWLTRGLVFSQKVLLKLVDKGFSREDAYKIVQNIAMETWKGAHDFKELLLNDKAIRNSLTVQEVEECFDVTADLKNIDSIFERVFN